MASQKTRISGLIEEHIYEFKTLWREECDEEISFEDAAWKARQLVDLYVLLGRPLPGELKERLLLPLPREC